MSTVVISYIPALHQGYINFFINHPGKLFVLDGSFIHETPRMERDIRAIKPKTITEMVRALGLMESVEVLSTSKQVATLPESSAIVMPDEDVNRNFAKKHLKGKKVEFISTFLRWDRLISTTELEVPPDRTISTSDLDKEIMNKVNRESQKSADWWRQIGAAVALSDKVALLCHNQPVSAEDYTVNVFGDPRSNFDYGEFIDRVKTIHAESNVIAEAARRGLALDGASMYVSTFPCPVCAKLIAASGIKKVYYSQGYSMLDAEDVLKSQNVEIILVKMESPPPTLGG